MSNHLALVDDVGIFGIHVEQIRFVRRLVAVAAGFGDDCCSEAVGHRIDTGSTNAAARAEASKQDTIDPE